MAVYISVIGSFVVRMSAYLPRKPYPGETIVANLFNMGPGGKGNNVAIAAKRLGAEITLIERVGNDLFADIAFDLYKKEKLNTRYIYKTDSEQTGVGLVYVQSNGENTAAFYKGANALLSPEDIIRARQDLIKSKILMVQLEVPDESVYTAIKLAKDNGLTIILDPAPARKLSDKILKNVDFLTPNIVEAFTLLDKPVPTDFTIEDIKKIANQLLAKGPKTIIITMGSKGALMIKLGGECIFQPSFPVKTIETVGAGDSFNAALGVSIAKGLTSKEALYHACINGALTTTKIGVDAFPTKKEVECFIKKLKK